jgi:hypothetical protein
MDPISITASITELLIAAAKVSTVLHAAISSFSSDLGLMRTVKQEVDAVAMILSQLQPFILGSTSRQSGRCTLIEVDQVLLILTRCVCTFSKLEREVDGMRDISGIQACIRLSRRRAVISEILQCLQGDKSSLNLILTIWL